MTYILSDLQTTVNDIEKTLPQCGAGDALSKAKVSTDVTSCLNDIQLAV